MPALAASTGSISANISGWSSASHARLRLIGPAVWCSVSRNVEATCGQRGSSGSTSGFSGRTQVMPSGLEPTLGYSSFLTGETIEINGGMNMR